MRAPDILIRKVIKGKPLADWSVLREILQKAPMLPPKKTAQE
jgi:hypothetical protein